MLRRLALRDFVIVPSLELDFHTGFSVLTGETGAGKSILIDALQLALGSRGDAGVVREGATRAEVSAEFDTPATLTAWLEEAGFSNEDSLLLRRTIDAQGKSRAWINGSPATITQLRELADSVGMPLTDGFLFVHNTLVGAGIRDKIKVGVSGKIVTGFDIARMLSLGADWCNSARGFMFAVGCIQSRSCHTNTCPTGVATQDPYRQQALDVPSKSERVASFHKNTLKSLGSIVGAVGLTHPSELKPYHIARRMDDGQIKLLSKYYYFADEGALLDIAARADVFNQMWVMADPDSFAANNDALIAYNQDSRDKGKNTAATSELA